jgi:hypothetical protein
MVKIRKNYWSPLKANGIKARRQIKPLNTEFIEAINACKAAKAALLGEDDFVTKKADYSALTESVKGLLGEE